MFEVGKVKSKDQCEGKLPGERIWLRRTWCRKREMKESGVVVVLAGCITGREKEMRQLVVTQILFCSLSLCLSVPPPSPFYLTSFVARNTPTKKHNTAQITTEASNLQETLLCNQPYKGWVSASAWTKHNTTLFFVILPNYPGLVQKLFSMFFFSSSKEYSNKKTQNQWGQYLYGRPSLHSSSIFKTVSMNQFTKHLYYLFYSLIQNL